MNNRKFELADMLKNTDWEYAKNNYELVEMKTCKIQVDGLHRSYEIAFYKLPDNSIEPYIMKRFFPQKIVINHQKNNMENCIEGVKNAFNKLKIYSTTSERGDAYLNQLNYTVERLKKTAKFKNNKWSDFEIAHTIKECEDEVFPEFSNLYEHSLSKWVNETLKSDENCSEGISADGNSSLEQGN